MYLLLGQRIKGAKGLCEGSGIGCGLGEEKDRKLQGPGLLHGPHSLTTSGCHPFKTDSWSFGTSHPVSHCRPPPPHPPPWMLPPPPHPSPHPAAPHRPSLHPSAHGFTRPPVGVQMPRVNKPCEPHHMLCPGGKVAAVTAVQGRPPRACLQHTGASWQDRGGQETMGGCALVPRSLPCGHYPGALRPTVRLVCN